MKTAEEFLKNFTYQHEGKTYHLGEWESSDQENEVKLLMIKFAQMHVEAALKKASHVLEVNNDADYIEHPTPRRILNSYPLTNIK